MSNQPIIDKHKEAFRSKSDSELISLYRQFQPHAEMSLAAQQILHERKIEAEKAREEREIARHQETQNKLEELKKPHWTVSPNFWFTFIAAISGVAGCLLTWHSARQPKSLPPAAVQQSAMSTAQQPLKKILPRQLENMKIPPGHEPSLRH